MWKPVLIVKGCSAAVWLQTQKSTWKEFPKVSMFSLRRSPKRRRSRSRSGSRKRKHRKRSRSRSRDRKRKSSRSYSSERHAREREKERQKKGLPPIRSKTLSGQWKVIASENGCLLSVLFWWIIIISPSARTKCAARLCGWDRWTKRRLSKTSPTYLKSLARLSL